ncbi:MAG: hypothetical protein ACOZCO_11965 [Bacteroidota bacterium]
MEASPHKVVGITHNQGMDWLLEEREKAASKDKVVNLFLASLSTRQLSWRSFLSAWAVAKNMKKHQWSPSGMYDYTCPVCADFSVDNNMGKDLPQIDEWRKKYGALIPINNGVVTLAFYLDQLNRTENILPDDVDLGIFTSVINLILDVPVSCTPNDLEKKLSKLKAFKSNKEERRGLIETLGYLGILETKEHKGYYLNYNDTETREARPRGAAKNDWAYPVRFWKGKDGVNEAALMYWFGMNIS